MDLLDVRLHKTYRSATKFNFSPDQADAIVRVAAYHRRDFELSTIWFPAREHVGIRQSIATSSPRTPDAGLGTLDRLPLELLQKILLCLDMQSLFNFRQANLRSRQTADSLYEYQRVVSHGLNLFCALLRTRLAVDVSLSDFYQALCTKACGTCGRFGGFVLLLAWHRCCATCVERALGSHLRDLAIMKKEFNLPEAEIKQLRTFKTLPGIYTMEQSIETSRVEVASAHQAGLAAGETLEALARIPLMGLGPWFNFAGACALPYFDRRTDTVENGVSCAGCYLRHESKMASREWHAAKFRDMVYARDSFLDHFRWCKHAQILWTSSEDGRREPPELPKIARDGGLFESRE